MTYDKVLVIVFFVSLAACGQALRNTDSSTVWNHTTTRNSTLHISSNTIATKDKVELKVYYETLCPASVDFFITQLKPAVKRLGSHLDVHLIPYGHAKTYRSHGQYSFNCQHGPAECYGNMVHACAIDVLRNITHAVLFNSCLMQYTSYHFNYDYFVSVLSWCGYAENVHIFEIGKCMKSRRSAVLLRDYGDETHRIKPPYVPYLMLDGSTQHQDDAERNLVNTVCQILSPKPVSCSHS